MRQPLNPSQSRVPTGNWAGYGFSKSTRTTSGTDKGMFCDPQPDSTTALKACFSFEIYKLKPYQILHFCCRVT